MKDFLLKKADQVPNKVARILHCDVNKNAVIIKADSQDDFALKLTVLSAREQKRRRNPAYQYFSID